MRGMEKVCVVGMGYVGIPVAVQFALSGFGVAGIEISQKKVELLGRGVCTIEGDEPRLAESLKDVVSKKKLVFSSDYSVCRNADAVIICVQTPFFRDGNKPDYACLKSAVESIGANLKKGALVVVESTIAPGTIDKVVKPLLEEKSGMKAGTDFYLAHCPERVMPGRLLENLNNMDRVVGGINEESTKRALAVYGKAIKAKLHPTSALVAEVVKTGENAYRNVQIGFANELALMCENLGVDAFEVRGLINTSPHRDVHMPGAGVGGHCIPKDPWLLVYGSGMEPKLIIESCRLNDSMPNHVSELIGKALAKRGRKMEGSKIAILGLAYLENSDDTRNSPSVALHGLLREKGASVSVFDPYVKSHDGIELSKTLEDAVSGADCIALMTAHSAFRNLDLKRIKGLVRTPLIMDGRNHFDNEMCKKQGFGIFGVGKKFEVD